MIRHVVPAVVALFIWWASTALIMWVYRRPSSYRLALPLGHMGLPVALWALWVSRNDTGMLAMYAAFTCGVYVSGWHLLTLYSGRISGPSLQARHNRWPRLLQAVYACWHHEILGVGLAALVIALTWNGSNQVGTATLLMLWLMHQSAQLNVLLGVRNFDPHLLPSHLDWLRRVMSRRRSNRFFPLALGTTLSLTGWLAVRAIDPTLDDAQAAGATMLCVLMAMAFFEHALLMLPEPAFRTRSAQTVMLPEE